MLTYLIAAENHCRSIESFINGIMPAASPAYIRKLMKSGACLVNNKKVKNNTILFSGDTASLKESKTVLEMLGRPASAIDILWQDDSLLAINKPAGLAMHPAAEVSENLVDKVSVWLSEKIMREARAYPVNRLDRGTSGVALLATSSLNAGILGRQVKEQGLDKVYLAVVEGRLAGEGIIDLMLDSKESVTRFRSIADSDSGSFLLVEPVTGRTHQIRRHLSSIGHPVVGDKRYNAAPLPDFHGIALHSFRTRFFHPAHDNRLTICAPLPAAICNLVTGRCGLTEDCLLRTVAELCTHDGIVT